MAVLLKKGIPPEGMHEPSYLFYIISTIFFFLHPLIISPSIFLFFLPSSI